MHIANELLSVPVAAGSAAIAAGVLGLACRKAKSIITSEKTALMGILGAFVFAAQMVNFQLPAMPGTSGHMVGAVLLAIILGPRLGAIVLSSVVIIQCLIFQDGGILALGCNIINMAIVPSYTGYFLYRLVTGIVKSSVGIFLGTMTSCLVTMEIAAGLVVFEVALSGVLLVPAKTFLLTMLGVHAIVGLCEGLITTVVVSYVQQTRPDIIEAVVGGRIRLTKKAVLATLAVFTVVIAAGLSLVASSLPDGLEWSYLERPDQANFKPIVSNESTAIVAADRLQSKYTVLPDYSVRASAGQAGESNRRGWTSFAGLIGSAATMAAIWIVARILRKNQPHPCTP